MVLYVFKSIASQSFLRCCGSRGLWQLQGRNGEQREAGKRVTTGHRLGLEPGLAAWASSLCTCSACSARWTVQCPEYIHFPYTVHPGLGWSLSHVLLETRLKHCCVVAVLLHLQGDIKLSCAFTVNGAPSSWQQHAQTVSGLFLSMWTNFLSSEGNSLGLFLD